MSDMFDPEEQRVALRRHNAKTLRRLKNRGMTVSEIADEFQVSEAGVRELLRMKVSA